MKLLNTETQRRLAECHPEAATEIDSLQRVLADSSFDQELLTLCSSFFDASLRGNTWSPPRPLSDLESASLVVCEQFMVSVADVSDKQIFDLSRHLSPDELYNFMYAIYVIEASQRLSLTLERVLQ